MMTGDEAQRLLKQIRKWLVSCQLGPSMWPDQLEDVSKLLSSCACREPIAEWVVDIDPTERRRVEEGMEDEPWVVRVLSFIPDVHIPIPRFGPEMSALLIENTRFRERVRLVFLPAEEEGT